MGLSQFLVIGSVLISIVGGFAYARDTFRGVTRPNRVSWGMWALGPMIGTGAALSAGADPWATSRIFFSGFTPLMVFILSFTNSKAFWKLTRFDALCGLSSFVAMVLWLGANSPVTAILFAALGDGFASIPTILKAVRFPQTETGFTYVAGFVSTLMVLPSIPVWNIENSAFQVYLLIANAFLVIACYRKKIMDRMGLE